MCGVSGIVGPGIDPALAEAAVGSMLGAQRHRGPDEQRTAVAPGAVLGTARLAVIDTARSKQPMRSPDGRYTLCFNGELLNFKELRRHAAVRDWSFLTSGDTEVVLALLTRMGPAALPLFNGQFAGGLWDAERRRLTLFRDRFGILPLYYSHLPDGLAFASTIRALTRLAPVDASLDPLALSDIFTLWAPHPPNTICHGVRQLPCASWASFSEGRLTVRSYWEPDFPEGDPGPVEGAEEDLLEALRGAVDRSLRADLPVGTLVSGGLDSALLTALAAREPGRPSFSVAFEDPVHDESPHQRHVVAAAATTHRSVLCSPHALARALPTAVAHAEAPFLRLAPCSTYLLGRLVHEAGVKTVISGEGADEMFGGYDLFRELAARRGAGASAARLQAAGVGGTPAERVAPPVLSLLMEGGGSEFFPAHQLRWKAGRQVRGYLSAELREELDDPAERLAAALPSRFGSWSELARAQFVEMRTLLPDYILSTQGERMLMAHSVEARIPYLDNEVVALALRLGDEDKVRGGSEKDVLRRAAEGLVPAPVLARRKQAYRAPVAAVLRCGDGLEAREALRPEALLAHGIFDPTKVGRLTRRLETGEPLSGTQEMALAGIVTTQFWLDLVAREGRERKKEVQA